MIIEGKENIILAYFTVDKVDYVLYTIDDGNPLVYLSKVVYHPKEIDFVKVDQRKKELKQVVKEFLVNDHNYAFLRKIGYNSLELDQLKANTIHKKGSQTIQLSNEQYKIFSSNDKLKRKEIKRPFYIYILIFLLILAYFIWQIY